MAARKRLTYEVQAKISVALAAVGLIAALAAVILLARNFKPDTKWVVFDARGMFQPVLGLALLASLAASGIGLLVGLNSAGQRRNTRSRLSWTGFFLSAGVVTLALTAALFFVFTRYPLVTQPT